MAAAALSATNQRTQNVAADPTLLTLDRLFDSSEFRKHGLREYRWSQRTAAYFTFEVPQAGGKGRDLRRNDAATGLKEGVVPASAFVPELRKMNVPGYGQCFPSRALKRIHT